jgi:hypothetical protein
MGAALTEQGAHVVTEYCNVCVVTQLGMTAAAAVPAARNVSEAATKKGVLTHWLS